MANIEKKTPEIGLIDFRRTVDQVDPSLLFFDNLKTLQLNLGNRCNQSCTHCHVSAGPDGDRVMQRSVMGKVINFLKAHPGLIVDITGGCPELNPDYRFFLENVAPLAKKFMARTNLSIFFEPGMEWIPKWYRDHKVTVVASLPCYTSKNVDAQRGSGVFDKSIKAIKILNEMGYGKNDDLELDLVYNPGKDSLPALQSRLEAEYKVRLKEDFAVTFTKLFTITNAPIGRFKEFLEANGGLKEYIRLLAENFNPSTVSNIMCRTLISADYRGILYNCDFNQALDMPIRDSEGNLATIENLAEIVKQNPQILTDLHCYCCTAGAGSSCTGALQEQNAQKKGYK